MYHANGIYYTEEHSVSFGDFVTRTSGGSTVQEFQIIANTWNDWHLIPSSRPSVAHPTIVTKFIEIPGADGMLDLTDFLSGRANFGQRQGTLSFQVANDFENWETIRSKIISTLHGKRLKMILQDDPDYYYDGRYTVGNWESGASNSAISISYQLDPYKISLKEEGSEPTLWDPFNFETDYDYYVVLGDAITVNEETKTFDIYADEYPFVPYVTWISGNVTAHFGGVTRTLSSAKTVTLGPAQKGHNVLTVNGNGSVKIGWRGGAL